jgi:hypothetical protein
VSAVALRGEAAEVALGEAQAVLSMVHDPERRLRLADLVAAIGDGEVDGADAESLEELLELGLQTGRLRALYGPGGEQAALSVYRKLPRGRSASQAAREVSDALKALEGRALEKVSVQAAAPGEYIVEINTDGLQLSVRLGRNGARLGSVGV